MAARFMLHVEDVDGNQRQVIADQRDIVQFERIEKISARDGLTMMPVAMGWCLAYYAEKRTGFTTKTRDEWEAGTVSVLLDEDDIKISDPTRATASMPPPSPSRSRPVSRSRKS